MAFSCINLIAVFAFWLGSIRPNFAAFCPIGCTCIDDSFSPSVECDGAALTSIPILFNPRIRVLRLSNNQISSVLLDELSFYTELEHFDLSNNKILSVERGAFYKLQKLKTLQLNGNLLASLSIESFAGLNELRILDLSDNGLRRLPASVFSDLRRLEILNISKNSINHISPGALTGLASLKELYVQYNELATTPTAALRSPHSLKILDLSYNRLERVEDNSFSGLKELEILNLAGNAIDTIDERAFSGLRSLNQLTLDANRLRRVPTISFRPLTTLRSLSISDNHLFTELATSAFEGLPLLRQLIISRCSQLRRVEVNAFSGLTNLEMLALTENRVLSFIDARAFEFGFGGYDDDNTGGIARRISPLLQVYLYGNNFSSIPQVLLPWSRLDELDLRWNPWQCDCDFGPWIGEILRKIYRSRSNGRPFPDGATCVGPDHLRGRRLHTLNSLSEIDNGDDYGVSDFDQCQSSLAWTTSVSFILSAAVIFVGLSAITIYVIFCLRYRRKLLCYGCCATSSYSGISPLRYRYAPPPGLPELCRYTKPIPVEISCPDDHDSYGVRKLLADRRKGEFYNTKYSDYPGEQGRFFYEDNENQYATCSTSGYYSGLVSDTGSSRLISTPNLSTRGSFRILQQYPVPITEL